MVTTRVWMVAAIVLLVASQAPLLADDSDAKLEEQYNAIALARTKAELSLRHARTGFERSDVAWRIASSSADAAFEKAQHAMDHQIEEEQAKDDARDDKKIEGFNKTKEALESDWRKFSEIERPALDTRYHDAINMVNSLNELFGNLSNLEHAWKDTGMDLGLLEKAYTALAARVDECRQAAQKALTELQAAQGAWAKRA